MQTKGPHVIGDASAYSHLTIRVRSTIPYSGFKVLSKKKKTHLQGLRNMVQFTSSVPCIRAQADFATLRHPDTQFSSFKADFPSDFNATSSGGDWVDVAIPFTSFTWVC